ncbi:scavenger receptor cysteine-rich type 1 protein M130-like isoform X2 [Mya arenaria]|uniref:scavenger receptor cysteine-rich type 1 protein M130-like isoform X2 n=1 Tax=Mya arenaria TaxID=6604 RepID=UPI0022E3F68B|nr:scavenger receptor cysteine-rich type 1 protein M130-like isoform X2 [Mya arenaria]
MALFFIFIGFVQVIFHLCYAASSNIRLVGGSSQYSGRVEIQVNQRWSTICHHGFSDTNAAVICRMLNFPTTGAWAITNLTGYPNATIDIWLDHVMCNGSEKSIVDCDYRIPMNSTYCNHSIDVGVICSSTADINISLIGGLDQYSGRLEIELDNRRGTVCGDLFSDRNAAVVCRMLNFPTAGARAITNFTGYPTAPAHIWLDDVECTGSEQSIADCTHRIPWGSHNCNHNQDVGVVCSSISAINIQLVGGSSVYNGRVEIQLHGRFGTVCSDNFSDENAVVVCRMLNLPTRFALAFTNLLGYPRAPDMIWLDDVVCTGSEQSIAECTHRIPWGSNDCNHNNDVGVDCFASTDMYIRLVGGLSQYSGRVEVLFNKQWGSVCRNGFSDTDAVVVCRMLNLPTAGARAITNFTGYPTAPAQIWLDELRCTGCEQSIADCTHRMPWGSNKCNHNEDVGVVCSSTAANDIRLVGGSSQYSGRVEILYNGTWGTLCDNGFSDRNAIVACKMLNFTTGFAQAITNLTNYPTAPAQIWLDDFVCTGCEKNIADCNHRHWGSNNCNHDDDVGVICSSSVSLINGSSPYSGIVVGHLRTFCDLGFSKEAANVTCTSLGFGEYSRHYHMQVLGNGDGDTPMLKKSITCIGTEKDLEFCDRSEAELEDCQPDNAVGIECKGGPIRLYSYKGIEYEGTFQFFDGKEWRSIINRTSENTAKTLCSLLGFGYVGSSFGQENLLPGTEYVSLDCNGTEKDIAQCKWTRGNNDGEYGTLVLFCSDYAIKDVRLSDSDVLTGFIEVSVNNYWWKVCYTGFTEYAADLICQTLGHGKNEWFTKDVDSNRYSYRYRYRYSTIGSLICDKNDKLLRDCKVIPMAFYSYGPGECDGNKIKIKCLEDSTPNNIFTAFMCILLGVLVVGSAVYFRKEMERSIQDRIRRRRQRQQQRQQQMANTTRGEGSGGDDANATIDDNGTLAIPLQAVPIPPEETDGNDMDSSDSEIRRS